MSDVIPIRRGDKEDEIRCWRCQEVLPAPPEYQNICTACYDDLHCEICGSELDDDEMLNFGGECWVCSTNSHSDEEYEEACRAYGRS